MTEPELLETSVTISTETSLTIMRVVAMVTIFVVSVIFATIPLVSKAFQKSKVIVDIANSFAGGLFIALGLAHILPESIEIFDDYYEENGLSGEFPWPNVIALCSYVAILFLEKVIIGVSASLPHELAESPQDQVEDHSPEEAQVLLAKGEESTAKQEGSTQKERQSQAVAGGEHDKSQYGTILLVGLTLDGFFEGIAMGIQTDFIGIFNLYMAVILHKWAEALALGSAFFNTKVPKARAIVYILIFGTMPTVGILLGILITTLNEIYTGIANALVVGMLLYIATCEVIQEAFKSQSNHNVKISFVCVGVIFVALLDVVST